MKKRFPHELEILKTNILDHPEPLSLFEDDDSFLALARQHARIKMMFEQNPAEDKAIIADLTGLAKVPPHLEARFRWEISKAINESRQRWIRLGGPLGGGRNRVALRKAEQKIRDALYAVNDLHPVELEALYNAFLPRWISLDDDRDDDRNDNRGNDCRRVTDLLSALLVALSEVSGRSPNRHTGARGRPKGDAGDWAFQSFVRTLWIAAHRCQGTLSANSRDGAMLRALKRIKPMLPPDLQRNALPYQTIVRATKAGKSEAQQYQSFTGDEEIDDEIDKNDEEERRLSEAMREKLAKAVGLRRPKKSK